MFIAIWILSIIGCLAFFIGSIHLSCREVAKMEPDKYGCLPSFWDEVFRRSLAAEATGHEKHFRYENKFPYGFMALALVYSLVPVLNTLFLIFMGVAKLFYIARTSETPDRSLTKVEAWYKGRGK